MTRTITIATDADNDTLQNLRQNLQRVQMEQETLNKATSVSSINGTNTTPNIITCQQLIWGNSLHIQSVLETLQLHYHCIEQQQTATATSSTSGDTPPPPITTSTTTRTTTTSTTMNDTTITCDDVKKFDIILGSDIIYVEHVVEPLLNTVAQLLRPYHGVFLLAFARRNVSIDYVLSVAQQQGFVCEFKELTAIGGGGSSSSDALTTTSPSSSSSTMEGVYIFRLRPEQ